MSDAWKSYKNLEKYLPDLDLTHQFVNHTENFVDPDTGCHTQNIESLWSVIKRKLCKGGINNGNYERILDKIYADIHRKRFFLPNTFEK